MWLGHAICIAALARCLLAVLHDVSLYILAHSIRGRSGVPPPSVRRVMRLFSDLSLLAQINMAAPTAEEVYGGDASTNGWALMSTHASYAEVGSACRHHERWRFHQCVSSPFSELLLGSAVDSLGGFALAGGGAQPRHPADVLLQGFFARLVFEGRTPILCLRLSARPMHLRSALRHTEPDHGRWRSTAWALRPSSASPSPPRFLGGPELLGDDSQNVVAGLQ